jgi:hypothetical protein
MTNPPMNDGSVGELVKQLSEQTSRLVREELKLAELEMKAKGKRAGMGVGMLGGAGLLAFYGGGALLVTIGLALAIVLDAWLAALIITVALFVIAGAMALIGKKKVSQATPLAPEQAIATTKHSVDTVKERARNS